MSAHYDSARPAPDKVLTDIVDYVRGAAALSDLAYQTAHYCLLDTLGCGLEALEYPACTKLLGPIVPGTTVPGTMGPSSLAQAGYVSASSPQPSVSSRQ